MTKQKFMGFKSYQKETPKSSKKPIGFRPSYLKDVVIEEKNDFDDTLELKLKITLVGKAIVSDLFQTLSPLDREEMLQEFLELNKKLEEI